MAVCPACHAEGWEPGTPCPKCGGPRPSLPSLVLDLPPAPPARAVSKRPAPAVEQPIELAIDLSSLRPTPGPHSLPRPRPSEGSVGTVATAPVTRVAPASAKAVVRPGALDDDSELVRSLAGYGDPPAVWYQAPLYVYRVLVRKSAIRAELARVRQEARRSALARDASIVSFAERVRPLAEKQPAYAALTSSIRAAEELVISRDSVLAGEQQAHIEKLATLDARLSKRQVDLDAARSAFDAVAAESSKADASIARAQAQLARAEVARPSRGGG